MHPFDAMAPETEEESYVHTDDEIVSLVQREYRRSGSDYDTSISKQREQSYRYYYGLPFGNERLGFSRHVSMDVFEAVEDVKAELLDTFTSGPKVLRFEEEMEGDQAGADDATDYVHAIFYNQNRGYNILKDVIHDGLVAKIGCVKYCWYERVRVTPESFTDVPAEQLPVLLSQGDIEDWKITDERKERGQIPTQLGPVEQVVTLVSGEITRRETVGQVKIEALAPENIVIDSAATDPAEARRIIIVYPDKSKGELVAEGYDPDLVESLSTTAHESLDRSRHARHSIDSSWLPDDRAGEDDNALVDVLEAFFDIDMDGDGIPETWKFTIAGNVLLDKERVSRKPVHFWTPYRIPHKTIGLSLADITMDIQRTNSGLIRGVVDNVFLTNTSMKIADLSIIRNPRDLIDNPIGAVINSPDPQAVSIVPQPQVNPATFNALGMLLEQKTGRTGLSKLPAQQVVSHQNSEDMINTLMAEGKARIAEMARSFAETFLKPLFVDVYNIGVEYGQVVGIATDTGYRVLDPSTFKPVRNNMKIAVALTADERAKRAQALMNTYQTLSQDPQMSPLFGVEEKYALLTDFFESIGTGSPRYLKNPMTPKGQQAMQQAAQQAQMQQQAQAQGMQAQMALVSAQIAKLQAQAQELAENISIKREENTVEGIVKGADMKLEREKFEWDKEMDIKEYELEKTQNRNVSIKGGN